MITVNLRDKNNIINLNVDGKVPIRGKTSHSIYFHDPLELLLSALGLCSGGLIINYCRLNNINVNIFESITIIKKDEDFLIQILHPKDFDIEHKKRIQSELENCPIAKLLKNDVFCTWSFNNIPVEELVKEQRKSCCGGN